VKAHACGNDFLILEDTVAKGKHEAVAQRLCHRHTGVGADGVEFLKRNSDGSFFLRLFNADGSEAELSGNGTRCVAAWLAESEGLEDVVLGTHAGLRSCYVVRQERREWWIESSMGVPRVMPRRIEIAGVDGVIEGAMVNVGNPHYVIFPQQEDFSTYGQSWQELGARIATDKFFPHGTNVEFVRLNRADEIAFRIFERGCGPTSSSGTGTCASAAAAMTLHGASRSLVAIAEGGAQSVAWPHATSEMLLTGPAEIICRGEVELA
jgi:diaminopimelate epimerase